MRIIGIFCFFVFFIVSCATGHDRPKKVLIEKNKEVLSEPVGRKYKFISEDVSAKYTWGNPKGFGGGYFDVIYDNGTVFAIPSNFANALGEFEIDFKTSKFNDCVRDKPKAMDELIRISGYPKSTTFGRDLNIRNSNYLGDIEDVEIDGAKGWNKLIPQMAARDKIYRWQASLCYKYKNNLTTPDVLAEGVVSSWNVINYIDAKTSGQKTLWSRSESPGHQFLRSSLGVLVLFRFADNEENEVFRSDAENKAGMIRYMADLLAKKMLSVPSKPNFDKPVLESIPAAPVVSKNEFETSSEFDIRKNRVLNEWENKVSIVENNNAKKISQHDDFLKKMDVDYAENLKLREDPLYRSSIYNKSIERAITRVLGRPVFKNVVYDADAKMFSAKVVSTQFPDFFFDVKIPVEKEKAVSYKKKMLSGLFYPKIVLNSDFTLFSADLAPNEDREKAEYNFALKSQSAESYDLFLERYPDSKYFKDVAAQKKSVIDKKESVRLEELRKKESRENAERERYSARKHVGESVCKPGNVAFGLISVTVRAFVEQLDGGRIKLRISNTEGQSINYNGSKLNPGMVIWDDHYEWKKCQ